MENVDFSLVLLVAVVLTGVLWFFDKLVTAKRRTSDDPEPWWVDYGAGFFPVLFVVFALRSFFYEPYQIPSESMMPTLEVGDFILVNRWTYGLRTPVTGETFLPINEPERGDVLVFRFPEQTNVAYIKRIIGLPGDVVEVRNKQILVNGEPVPTTLVTEPGIPVAVRQSTEQIGSHTFPTWRTNNRLGRDGRWEVPEGNYFLMGDNRDNSNDSRFWGFVPDHLIIGKAVSVWMHWDEFFSLPSFSNVRAIP